ncbi:efflux RND transporter permease subunit (plasmid) [Streptomyces halstedii]|uniref:hypothetical protein n=1 Tax=Streptomyces halstedii TaxID=1944 RepID=UPI002F914D7C
MPIPRLSPDDPVRVTISARVVRSGPGYLELSPRTYLQFESEDDVEVEVVTGTFRCGDVVTDGSRTLLRTVVERDGGTEAYWTAADGSVVRDDEVRPGALRLLVRLA